MSLWVLLPCSRFVSYYTSFSASLVRPIMHDSIDAFASVTLGGTTYRCQSYSLHSTYATIISSSPLVTPRHLHKRVNNLHSTPGGEQMGLDKRGRQFGREAGIILMAARMLMMECCSRHVHGGHLRSPRPFDMILAQGLRAIFRVDGIIGCMSSVPLFPQTLPGTQLASLST